MAWSPAIDSNWLGLYGPPIYERHYQPVLPRRAFLQRITRHASAAGTVILGSLAMGMLGYHFLEHFSWVDALLNASMILGGMGPVGELKTTAGKIFASFYALYSGLVVLVTAGIIFAPVLHRFLHRFHVDNIEREHQSVALRNRRRR